MNSSRCFWFDSYTKLDSQRLHAWMDFILVSSSFLHFLLLTFNWQMVDWVTFRVLIDYTWWSLAFTERHYKKQDTLLLQQRCQWGNCPQCEAHLRNSFGTQGQEKLIFPRGTCVFSYQQKEYRWMCLIVFPFPFSLWLPRSSEAHFWLNINNFVGPCGLHTCILSFFLVLTFYPAVFIFLVPEFFCYLYFSILLLVFL